MNTVLKMGQTFLWKRLLAGDLTVQEQAVQERLRAWSQGRAGSVEARRPLQDAAVQSPETFFAAALALLVAEKDPAASRRLYTGLLDFPQFLRQFIRPQQFSRTEVLEGCRSLALCDPGLDVRLAQLISGRELESEILDSATVVHVLDLLNEISTGSRLVPILSHLTHHSDLRIAAKATLLVARRIQNQDWIDRHLASSDPRLRATVLEALWGVDTPLARKTLWAGAKDENNRAVGNALVGLHLLGEPGVAALVGQILEDSRPLFRATGAWVMGKIGAPDFVQPLQRALADAEPGVRHAARRALVEIRKRTAQDQSPPVSTPPPEVAPELPTAPGPTAIEDAAPPQPPQGPEGVHTSTT
jgi:HEAT repeat protein